ncbi:MAG: molybdopterin-dependent oxidoreductase [Streptosporangiales bacterium]|nr:molybdopterin-dependent oxidoreductase [Streptosporangiales bacterium]
MSILGTRVVRAEDPRLLTVGGTYVDDLREPALVGAAHATFVRSPVAHARISSIDVQDAREAPGVVAVFTGRDLDISPSPPAPMVTAAMARPALATDVVRYVGEAVAVVITDERYQGEDAAELVMVDYDPLPAVVSGEDAVRGETLLFPEAGTNVAWTGGAEQLDEHLFDDCEVVVTQVIDNQRLAPAPLEVRSAACAWSDDQGQVTLWLSTQGAQAARDELQRQLGLEEGQLRVVAPDVGGGFGAKIAADPETAALCAASRRLGRPLRWVESRSENMIAMTHGRAQHQTVTIGGRRDGTVLAYRIEVLQDSGAYPRESSWLLPILTMNMASGVYAIPKVETAARSIVTNTTPLSAYRGAGRPEATAAIERAMDLFASEIGMDPAEVRRRNFVAPDAFPFQTPSGITYDSGEYAKALDTVLEAAGYPDLQEEQRRRRERGDPLQLGFGLSAYVEITAPDNAVGETGRVEVGADGSVTVYTGSSAHGQGHATAFAMLASDELGIPMDRIKVLHGDTAKIPKGAGTYGSRSLQLGGSAVHEASVEVVKRARHLAAELLEADEGDIVLDRDAGRWHVKGAPATAVSWGELAQQAEGDGGLAADSDFSEERPTFPFGVHLAVVEVDVETGAVRLVRFVSVDDAGRVVNPVLTEGQRHGGIAQGAAQALLEHMVYDADGNPQTGNLADYAFITAAELPSFELLPMETATPLNPLGVKGIGEAGTIGSTPAVQNAVVNAITHLGVRHVDMPATAQRVWAAINEAKER